MNPKNITEEMQRVAVDILEDYIMHISKAKPFNKKFYDTVKARYDLREDPFTDMPCTTEEYYRSLAEYVRQEK